MSQAIVGDRRGERPTLVDRALSALCWTASVSWLVPWTGTLTALQSTLGAERVDVLSRAFCRGLVAATGSRWKKHVDPAVDPNEPYVFAQNHINHFDFVSMYPATPHFKQGVELETHFKYPVYGVFMRTRGTIPVPADRSGRLEAVREGMRRVRDKGQSVLAFPEGTRTLDGRVGPFRKGIFVAARDLGMKVVPTAVTGMYDVMRKGSLIIRPGRTVRVYCEAPVDFAGVSDEELPDRIEAVRSAIVRRVEEDVVRQHGERA